MHRIASAAAIAALIASTAACSSGSASSGSVAEQPQSVAATTAAVVEKDPLNAPAIIDIRTTFSAGPTATPPAPPPTCPDGDEAGDKYSVERGLVVEVFGRADLAQRRSDYIKCLQSASPILGTEWHSPRG